MSEWPFTDFRRSDFENLTYCVRQRLRHRFGCGRHRRFRQNLHSECATVQIVSGELFQKLAVLVADWSCCGGAVHVDDQRASFQFGTETMACQRWRQLAAYCVAQTNEALGFDCQQFELGTIAGEQCVEGMKFWCCH